MVRALLVLCCSEIEMQILLSRPTSEFSHTLGQIRPSCSIAVYGSSSSDSCRSSRMPATAESGHQRTHALQQKTSAWSLSPARKADVTSYPSCQWDVPLPIIAMGSTGAVGG